MKDLQHELLLCYDKAFLFSSILNVILAWTFLRGSQYEFPGIGITTCLFFGFPFVFQVTLQLYAFHLNLFSIYNIFMYKYILSRL